MSGCHVRQKASYPGLAVLLLGLLGLIPPVLLIGGALEAPGAPALASRTGADTQAAAAVRDGSGNSSPLRGEGQ